MPSYDDVRLLACPAAHVFGVVMDIPAYPEFLPWVAEARILSREDDVLTAELVADFKGIRQPFRTVDRFVSNKLVEIRLLEGPFRFLESVWSFEETGETSCRIHFSIEFEFKSMMLGMVASPIFGHACMTMAHVFEKRAMALYEAPQRHEGTK
ncbi:MAG: type II toxin-antitoxin system RatA family toxin [Zetaproteobacteria bacterium]|nr:MAG: type II toxin-antitoxin system RatA family toxin [Zetaproteobacteria bacterium]